MEQSSDIVVYLCFKQKEKEKNRFQESSAQILKEREEIESNFAIEMENSANKHRRALQQLRVSE